MLIGMVSVKTAFTVGVEGIIAEVEAVRLRSLPSLTITGLAGDVVKESRERVLGCLSHLGFSDVPSGRVVVHLVPASEKKLGSHFDVAIALAVLAVENKIPISRLRGLGVLGELTLDGRVRPVAHSLAITKALLESALVEQVIVPLQDAAILSLLESDRIFTMERLSELIEWIVSGTELKRLPPPKIPQWEGTENPFVDVIGQTSAKRSLSIAVAGRHHLLLIGSPGIGKSLLAHAASQMQPPLTRSEMAECLKVLPTESGAPSPKAPFRSPHHSISAGALLGGGSGQVLPGELTWAHRGILFLDEFPEFRRDALEGLREPMESGCIHLHRVGRWLTLPARFTLIAAMNPCPCGFALHRDRLCSCTDERRLSYSRRISGPILDRMDLMVVLESEPRASEEFKEGISKRVESAVERQRERYQGIPHTERNGDVSWGTVWPLMRIPIEAADWVKGFSNQTLSLRSIHKILRVARTIADLEGKEVVKGEHVYEAWQFRCQSVAPLTPF